MPKPTFQFKIQGDGVTPESVRLRDLVETLQLVEAAIAETARGMGESDIEALNLSLVGITNGSADCTVAASPAMIRAASVVTRSLERNEFTTLPMRAQTSLRKLWKKSDNKGWDFSFAPIDNDVTFAQILHDREILRPGQIAGRTTLYGKCMDVGGKKPTAKLNLLSGETLTVELSSEEMAKQLGARLYEVVGLEGEAKWGADDWKLERFIVDRITEYAETHAADAFSRLAQLAGNTWDDVDPVAYVQDLRAD